MNKLSYYMRHMANRPTNGNGPAAPAPEVHELVCDRCKGRGWISRWVPFGHPDFGVPFPCDCSLSAHRAEMREQLINHSNLGSLTTVTFEDMPHLPDDVLRTAIEYADTPDRWLVIRGPHRSGKTRLAAAIANRRMAAGNPVFFIDTSDLIHQLRGAFSGDSDTPSEIFERVLNAEMLVLDGYAVIRPTPWAQEKLHQILNHRERAAAPTIITLLADPGVIDPFVRSRLLDRQLCRTVMLGSDQSLGAVPAALAARMTFEKWDPRGNKPTAAQRESLRMAYESALRYARNPEGWFTLFGDVGVGKTHLAVAIAVRAREKGIRVEYYKSAQMLDMLRASYSPEPLTRTYEQTFEALINVDLLVLDGVGEERKTEWAYEKLQQVLEHRHDLTLPTVLTTTIDITQTAGPIVSRIRDVSTGIFLRMDAPDFRIKRNR